MVDILALISSILFTPAFSISFFYETGVRRAQILLDSPASYGYNDFDNSKDRWGRAMLRWPNGLSL